VVQSANDKALLGIVVHAPSHGLSYSRFLHAGTRDGSIRSAFARFHCGYEIARSTGGRVGYVYRAALNGFSITLPLAAVPGIENRPDVAYIEYDLPMAIVAQEVPTGVRRAFVDEALLDIDGLDDQRVDVDVAVLDTGIDFEHPDLNVAGGTDCTLRQGGGPFARYYCGAPGEGTGGDDNHYHGTHVAGTIGALDNDIGVVGVAPGARLWAVKVLNQNGSGYTSGIIAGIDWTIDHGDIEVLNMSLGGAGISTAYRDAIDTAVANGVVVVVAAGNSDADANNYSPAYVPSAITVSALADFDGLPGGNGAATCRSELDDTLANFSNWGTAIDIAAPGVCITSTYPLEQGAYGTISGTSMAAPHVAGAAALLASGANAPLNGDGVQAIRDALVNSGNSNWSDDSGDGEQEPLLDLTAVGAVLVPTGDGGGGGPQPVPPTAGFSTICTFLSCTFTDQSTDDVEIKGWSWDFGDGSSSNLQNPAHDFTQAASYQVRLTVTDDDALEDTFTQGVTVTDGSGAGGVTLEVTTFKEKGVRHAWLTWTNISIDKVDIYVVGESLPRETNVSALLGTKQPGYDFLLGGKGGGNFLIQVCEAGKRTACSAEIPAVY
jgi:subtilisin family serine protease